MAASPPRGTHPCPAPTSRPGSPPPRTASGSSPGTVPPGHCTDAVNDHLAILRRRRAELAADPTTGGLDEVLARGNDHANLIAEQKLDQVRHAMDMAYGRTGLRSSA